VSSDQKPNRRHANAYSQVDFLVRVLDLQGGVRWSQLNELLLRGRTLSALKGEYSKMRTRAGVRKRHDLLRETPCMRRIAMPKAIERSLPEQIPDVTVTASSPEPSVLQSKCGQCRYHHRGCNGMSPCSKQCASSNPRGCVYPLQRPRGRPPKIASGVQKPKAQCNRPQTHARAESNRMSRRITRPPANAYNLKKLSLASVGRA